MKKLVIAPAARADLDEIWLYIAEDNMEAAEQVSQELREKFLLLASQPLIGRERPEIGMGVRSFPIGSYVVFYRDREEAVEIARVVHGARDVQSAI